MNFLSPAFPTQRLRRLRKSPELRNLLRETQLTPLDFVYPLFVIPGENKVEPIAALPGQSRLSVDQAVIEVEAAWTEGIRSVILFGLPDSKDEQGSSAWSEHAPVQQACRALKARFPQLVIMTDVCLCQYTSHGHCGPLCGEQGTMTEPWKIWPSQLSRMPRRGRTW